MSTIGPVRLFPDIISNKDFVTVNHPRLHPQSLEYDNYWQEQEKRCIEGLWFKDGNQWRYGTGPLYFLRHFCIVTDEIQGKSGQAEVSPRIRDFEWIVAYDYITCMGYSGYEDDKDFTSNTIVKKIEDGTPLSALDQVRILTLKHIKKEDGSYKKYVDTIEYLHKTHKKPLGRAVYENEAYNYTLLGSRGLGKSVSIANMFVLHEWLFDGVRYFEDIQDTKAKSINVVGAANGEYSKDFYAKIQASMLNIESSCGAYEDDDISVPGYLHKKYTGSFEPSKTVVARFEKKNRYGSFSWKGSHSIMAHRIFTAQNPQAAVGKRANRIVIDEIGLLEEVEDVHGSNKNVLTVKTKFGIAAYLGTGGNIQKVTGIKKIFENPSTYDMLVFKDEFEGRVKPICRFIPAYYAEDLFRDKLGNTNLTLAYQTVMERRKKAADADTSQPLDDEVMNKPIVPSEMFMSKSGLQFPVAKIRARKNELDIYKYHEKIWSIGTLEYTDKDKNQVTFKPDLNKRYKPILTYSDKIDPNDMEGALIIYEHPPANIPNPTYKRSLYKIVCDPVKDDHGGSSYYSIIVHKGFSASWEGGLQDAIVAEWIGRLDKVNDMHEIAIKLAHYYNAKILPETNISDIVRYCEMQNKRNLLQPALTIAIGKVLQNPSFKYDVGVDMSSVRLQEHATQLLRQWLLSERKRDDNGKVIETNIDHIYSLRLLSELEVYAGPKSGNYDHLRSAMILALWLSQEQDEPIELENLVRKFDEIEQYFIMKEKQTNNSFYYEY